MTRFVSQLASACGAAAVAVMLSAAPVSAQPGWGGMGGMWGMGGMMGAQACGPRAADATDWRITRIERLVRPTDAQRPKLDGLRKAWTRASEIIAAACPKDIPQSPVARLELMEKRLAAMTEALKVVRPAYAEFYGSLTADQQSRLNAVGPRRWGGMGGMGGMRGWRWQQ